MLIASNSRVTLTKVKNIQETLKCPRKKQITVQPEDFNKLEKQLTESVVHLYFVRCSENYEKISRKTSVVVYSF